MIIEDYLESRKNLKNVFMLVDFRHKPTYDDVLMYNFLQYYNIPVTIVATKIDKVKKSLHDKNKNLIIKELGISENDIILFSTITKVGKEEILNKIETMLN